MLIVLGYLVVILSVFGGFAASGGHLYALFQPTELVIIFGAGLGAFIVANNAKVIKATLRALKLIFAKYPYTNAYNIQLLSLFFELSNKIKKDGTLSIESDVENYLESPLFSKYPLVQKDKVVMGFLCDNLRLIITGRVDVMHLEIAIDTDIETYEAENELPVAAINKMADGMPAFGIVAAVMGVVHTMESMAEPPAVLGGLVAKALVGTFLGVLLGYGFIAPLATAFETRGKATIKVMQAIKVILISISNNFAPTIAVEMARKVLYSDTRPNSEELEAILREIKSGKTSESANGT